MHQIFSVGQLTKALDEIDPLQHAKIMKRIKIDADGLESCITWTKEGYTRNCLARTKDYEIILLCWDLGAKTPIHGHGGENCWVYQVQGTVEELRYEENAGCLKETNRLVLTPGKLTYMNDEMGYHSIENTSNDRALTLHIYASPIDTCKVFNEEKDCFEMKDLSYHTYQGDKAESTVF